MLEVSEWFRDQLAQYVTDRELTVTAPEIVGAEDKFLKAVRSGFADLFGNLEIVFLYALYISAIVSNRASEHERVLNEIAIWASEHFQDVFSEWHSKGEIITELKQEIIRMETLWPYSTTGTK